MELNLDALMFYALWQLDRVVLMMFCYSWLEHFYLKPRTMQNSFKI